MYVGNERSVFKDRVMCVCVICRLRRRGGAELVDPPHHLNVGRLVQIASVRATDDSCGYGVAAVVVR